MAESIEEALTLAERIGYPVIVRPSFVIGGLAIDFAYSPEDLARHLAAAAVVDPDRPVRIDRFLEGIEVDIDAVSDGIGVLIPGLLEHVERAGVHSGDSACVLPAPSVTLALEAEIRELAGRLAAGLDARGLLNVQLALHDGQLHVLEANPRASRTVPFVAKATGIPLVDHACRLLLGEPLGDLDLPERVVPDRAWAKEAIFPSERLAGAADRGVEMRSTGEVMASGATPVIAYRRALQAAGRARPRRGVGPPLQATTHVTAPSA
jgi:carbamoyl-phosphate synthase large subunit